MYNGWKTCVLPKLLLVMIDLFWNHPFAVVESDEQLDQSYINITSWQWYIFANVTISPPTIV